MRIWIALIVAPLLALTDQAIAFSLVGWACTNQTVTVLHAAHALFALLVATTAPGAWQAWRQSSDAPAMAGEAGRQRHFLAGVALVLSTFSAVTIVAMWIPTWMISACTA